MFLVYFCFVFDTCFQLLCDIPSAYNNNANDDDDDDDDDEKRNQKFRSEDESG